MSECSHACGRTNSTQANLQRRGLSEFEVCKLLSTWGWKQRLPPPKRCILSTMHTTVFRSPSSPPPFTNRRPTEGKSFHLINLALGETSTGKGQCDQNALCTCMKLSKSGLQSETMTAVSAALSPPPVGYPAPFLLRGGRQNWESNLTSQNSY